MALISTRVPEEIEKETKLEYALDSYKKSRITLMRAGEIAGLSLWEIIDIVRKKRIPMHYTLEDVKKDIEIAKDVSKKIS